jgi:glycosyltransferase involved in cell wall biosynthesis
MRLLMITNRYPVNADDPASPFVPHFAGALHEHGVHVDVLTPDYRDASNVGEEDTRAGVSVYRFATGATLPVGSWNFVSPGAWFRLGAFLRNGRELGESLCRQNSYDHILALWALPSGQFARAFSSQFSIPYSVWCLGSDIYVWAQRPFVSRRIASVLRGAAAVFGDGEDLCGQITAWLRIKVDFMPSFRPLPELGIIEPPRPTEAPQYLCLGRLHPAKGVFDLLKAFLEVKVILPQARLRYVGGGPAEEELRSEADRLGLSGAVEIAGTVGAKTVNQLLKESDCVVIPSHSDSIPLVFTEAVQAMRPVVGTDVGDLGTFIRRYKVGVVSPSTHRGDLALAMVRAAREPVFNLRGRDAMLNVFNPYNAAGQFCECVFGRTAMSKLPKTHHSATAVEIAESIRVE